MKFSAKTNNAIKMALLFLFIFVCMSFFVFVQPFGDGPDEINRFKVVTYIENHGRIPAGDDPEIILDGYGASYAFQPILTYMIDGFLLRALSFLSLSFPAKLIIARYVNVIFGLVAAFYTVKLSKLLFKDEMIASLFSLAVILLPQNIFIYTYVNTDGAALMAVIIMLYGLIRGYKENFDIRSLVSISLGIVICLLSYYNCYGYILVTFVAFMAYFIHNKDIKGMFKKGLPIAGIVILLAGWWFIRNAILYNGDVFALTARKACALDTGDPAWLLQMSKTYKNEGYSLFYMLFHSSYLPLVWRSFIAMFGPMLIPTHHYVYIAFALLFYACILGLFLPYKSTKYDGFSKNQKNILRITFIVGALIPAGLALFYSYSWDFQPQGRYYLPCLIPFFFLLTSGIEKLIGFIGELSLKITKKEKAPSFIKAFSFYALSIFFVLSLAVSVYEMVKYYSI